MAFQPCTNTVEVVVRGAIGARDIDMVNVFHCRFVTAELTQALADGFADAFSELYDAIKTYQAVDVVWNDVVVTDLRAEGANQFVSVSSFPKTGTSAQPGVADFVAVKTAFFGASRTRAARGGFFTSGLTTDAITGNTVTAGARSAIDEAVQDVHDTLISGGVPLSILSRFKDNAKRASGVLSQVNTWSTKGLASSMLGRKVGA